MNGKRETSQSNETASDAEDARLDPGAAARLLDQTTRQARRQFDMRPPLLTAFGAVVVLAAYGAIWLSVRGQDPYRGPGLTALAVMYAVVLVSIGVAAMAMRRALGGVGGRSARRRPAETAAFATIFIAIYLVQGALYHAGAGPAIVYGMEPATVPIIIGGSAAAAYWTARQTWREVGAALAFVVLASGAAFAGPVGAWGVMALGGCLILLAYAGVQAWTYRP